MIHYFSETEEFSLEEPQSFSDWLTMCVEKLNHKIDSINYIFCDDEYLLEINKKHLEHDYYTDIITFDYSDGKQLSGDIFISIERVADNAYDYDIDFDVELSRVMAHGLLHMMGFKDKTPQEQKEMRKMEDQCLSLLFTETDNIEDK